MNNESAGIGEPHRDISFHPTEGGAILFDAVRRRLYALNPAAGLTWLCIRDGLSQLETTRAIAEGLGIDDETATDWCHTSTNMFREHHLLEQDVTKVQSKSAASQGELREYADRSGGAQYFAIFDQTISIFAPTSLHADIFSLLGLLSTERPKHDSNSENLIVIDLTAIDHQRWEIIVDGHLEAVCETASVVAELERVLVEAIVPVTPHVLTLHAASLQRKGRTILLAGPSGSGKTTLSVALGHAGWTFGGDEIVLMELGATFRPLPLPPCIKQESFPLVSGWFPILGDLPSHQRYGRTIKFIPIRSEIFEACPGIVVFPTHQKGAEGSIKRIDGFEGLRKLLVQCVFVPDEFGHADVRQLQRFQDTVEYYAVTYDLCERAMELLEDALVRVP